MTMRTKTPKRPVDASNNILWILKLTTTARRPCTDYADGFVVRAPTYKRARELAAEQAGDEGKSVWLLRSFSTCRRLSHYGVEGVVLRSNVGA